MTGPARRPPNLLERERRNVSSFLITLWVVGLTGLATWIFPELGIWQQWTYLLHTLLGFGLVALFAMLLLSHVRVTHGFRRPGQALLGWTTALSFAAVAGSGCTIGLIGQYESQRWVYDTHIVTGLVSLLLVFSHILLYQRISRSISPEHAAETERHSGFTMAMNQKLVIMLMLYTILLAGGVAALTWAYGLRPSSFRDVAARPFESTYGDAPFRPSLAQTTTGTFLDARRLGRSEKCGECHQQITDQWRASMHGRSASDPFFQKNIHSLVAKKGMAASRYCGGCHMPIALLSGELSEGGNLDDGMHIAEGTSCMACHGILRAVSLKGVGSYLYEPEQHYLFGDSDSTLATETYNYLVKINPRQHRRDMARKVLSDPVSCATCHEQYIDEELNDWGWVQLQHQYQSWIKGPFSRQSDKNYSNPEVYRCQDCHFPLVMGEDPSADRNGQIRSHRTPGANTAVPYMLGDIEQLDTVIRFLTDNRIAVTLQLQSHREQRSAPNPGDRIELNVIVASNRIGHNFPAGTVDINEPWIELVVADADGRQIFTSGLIDSEGQVDRNARFYFSSLVDRHGKRVWRHDLFNAVGESYVKFIPPGGADVQIYDFTIPSWAKGPLLASARLRYRKFNQDYASWALDDQSVRLPIVDMATNELSILLGD